MSELIDQEYDLFHPGVAIEEIEPATFHSTYLDGERLETVAETIVEALKIAETPDGLVVPEGEVHPSLTQFGRRKSARTLAIPAFQRAGVH